MRLKTVKLLRSTNDRLWAFFIPVYIAAKRDSGDVAVARVALYYLVSTSCGMILTPFLSSLWKRVVTPRQFFVTENIWLVISAVIILAWSRSPNSDYLLVLAGFVASVESSISQVITDFIEKDAAFRQSRESADGVAQSNARLAQIDLLIAAVTPMFAAFLGTGNSTVCALILLQLINAAICYPFFMSVVNSVESFAEGVTDPAKEKLVASPHEGKKHPSIVMLSFSLLFVNAINPGGMFLAWLRSSVGLSEKAIAVFSGCCQLAGFLGAAQTPCLISLCGLELGAKSVIAAQAAFVTVAAFLIQFHSSGMLLGLLLVLIACSRVALWSYDLLSRQLIQEATTDASRLIVFARLSSWTKVASLFMYALGASSISFEKICIVSSAAVTLSCALMWIAKCHST
eukprot:TRINITY_DN10840_c1_g3_i2.p1 TRINITY_DN10840_c1_g3~~TRINITY_DN10840_c1_g3_i2.p1  ORF type:complete len:401 (-),score=37.90 TRINITY_DN10840_c1_g3_i2:504-1706(-)